MEWATIYGDKEALTQAELEAALKGTKLVDLSTGEYVAKEKFDRAEAKAKEAAKALTELEAATKGDDGLEAQVAKLTASLGDTNARLEAEAAQRVRLEREKLVGAKVASPKLAKLALIEAEGMVDDNTDFDTALAKVLEDPDYATDEQAATPPVIMRSGDPANGSPKGKPDPLTEAVIAAVGT